MATREFVPMSVGGILDRTFILYKENFVRYAAIVSVVNVPMSLLALLVGYMVQRGLGMGLRPGDEQAGGMLLIGTVIAGAVGVFLALVGQSLCNAALIKSVSASYLGADVSVGEAYRAVLPRLGTVIWAGFMVGIVVMVGLVLCVVPGIIFGLWFGVTIPALLIGNTKATQGMSRSRALVSGNLGKAFLVFAAVSILGFVIGGLFGYVGAGIGKAVSGGSVAIAAAVNQLFSLAANVLVAPIQAAASILLYYDLRIRKEGFDLEMLARSLGSGEAPDAGHPLR